MKLLRMQSKTSNDWNLQQRCAVFPTIARFLVLHRLASSLHHCYLLLAIIWQIHNVFSAIKHDNKGTVSLLVPQYRHLVRHSISHSTSVKRYGLRYIRYWISRKPLKIRAWFQRTTDLKWSMVSWMVTWLMTSCNPERSMSRLCGRDGASS